jgi:hypothetical protein
MIRAGFIFGVFAALPIVETLVYNTHVANGLNVLPPARYFEIGVLSLLLILLMVVSFVLPHAMFREHLARFRRLLDDTKKQLRQTLLYLALALPVIFLIAFFGGAAGRDLLKDYGLLTGSVLVVVNFVLVVLLLWLIAWLLQVLGRQFSDFRGAIDAWAFSIKLATVFYVLLAASSFHLIGLKGVNPDAYVTVTFGLVKDYLLLFIIANMLFGGLYKVAMTGNLKKLFQSRTGFRQFMLICAIIAIIAAAADFIGTKSEYLQAVFPEAWQRTYHVAHIYIRDIGLLILPIAGLLFWTLLRVGEEIRDEERRKTVQAQD